MIRSQPQAASASPQATTPAKAGTVPGALPSSAASPIPTRAPLPVPSLKPGESITWVKLDQPRLPLGEIIFSSLALVGLIALIAVVIGTCIGYVKSKRTDALGAGGLRLR